MVGTLKRQYNLAVLKLYLDRSDPEQFPRGQVIFEFEYSDRPAVRLTADAKSIGIPASLQELRSQYHYDEPNFQLPATVRQHLSINLPSQQPLWLELARPYGHLPVVSWERLLSSHVQRPILRLPYFALQPTINVDSLELVLCASTPEAKVAIPLSAIIDRITRIALESLQTYAVVHIFTDIAYYSALQERLRGLPANPAEGQVILYHPQETASFVPPERDSRISETPGQIDSPWLRWMSQALAGRGVDMVHFICHGYLASDQGALAFAETPIQNADRAWARFVGAQQLTTFLTQVGAWGVAFTSPETNFSRAGLRLLADQLARLRPGTVLLHDTRDDDGHLTALASAYGFLFNGVRTANPPLSAALSLYCHPAGLEQFQTKSLATSAFQPVADEYLSLSQEAVPLLTQAFEAALRIESEWARSKALIGLAPYLAKEQLNYVFQYCWAMNDEEGRLEALVALAPLLTEEQCTQVLQDILATERLELKAQALASLAPYLTSEQRHQAFQAVLTLKEKLWQVEALAGLAPYLTEGQLSLVLQTILEIKDRSVQAKALADLAPTLGKMGYASQILRMVLMIESESLRADAIVGLAPYLSKEEREEFYLAGIMMEDAVAQVRTLLCTPRGLDFPLSGAPYAYFSNTVHFPSHSSEKQVQIIKAIADMLSSESTVGVSAIVQRQGRGELLKTALKLTLEIKEEEARAEALIALIPHLKGASAFGYDFLWPITGPEYQAEVLSALAPYLNSGGIDKAMRETLAMNNEVDRLRILIALAPYLSGESLDQAWQIALAADNPEVRSQLMVALAPHLDEERLAQAFQSVLAIPQEPARAEALSRLAPYLHRETQQHTPGWVASSLRFVEQSAAQYLEQPPVSETHTAVHQGVEQALSYLSDVVRRHSSSASRTK